MYIHVHVHAHAYACIHVHIYQIPNKIVHVTSVLSTHTTHTQNKYLPGTLQIYIRTCICQTMPSMYISVVNSKLINKGRKTTRAFLIT